MLAPDDWWVLEVLTAVLENQRAAESGSDNKGWVNLTQRAWTELLSSSPGPQRADPRSVESTTRVYFVHFYVYIKFKRVARFIHLS
jgi:hypothetical protein